MTPSEMTDGTPTDGVQIIKIYLGNSDENMVSISDISADTDLSNHLYNSSTILQKYMDDNPEIDDLCIYKQQIPSRKSQDKQAVKYFAEVSMKASEYEWLAWIIFFNKGGLQMWVGDNDDEMLGQKLD